MCFEILKRCFFDGLLRRNLFALYKNLKFYIDFMRIAGSHRYHHGHHSEGILDNTGLHVVVQDYKIQQV
jgi:hypothetical protein